MLPLGPLPADEAERLAVERLSTLAGQAVLDRAADVVDTAAGNPFFIEQLAARLFETAGAVDAPLPNTIRALVAARLDALPAAERAVLLDAAVGGKVFWRGALEHMGRGEELPDQLASLERRDLIRRDTVSAIEGQQQYSFTHVLIRDTAYELLTRRQRRDGHRSYAVFLESTGAGHGETGAALARHWREAGETENALRYFIAAAEQADQGWAKERAVTFYREALELASDEGQQRQLRRRLALAEQAMYHLADAQALRGS
jgi:predicted ATPase